MALEGNRSLAEHALKINHEAVENTAVICSLLITCKAQEVNPREWLNDVIARPPYYQEKDSGKDIRELLPDV